MKEEQVVKDIRPHLHEGTLAPAGKYDWTCVFFGPPESTTQTANRSVQPFLHSSQQCHWACPGMSFPLIIAPLHWDLGPSQHMLPWAHPSPNPNGISTGSAVFAQRTAESPYTLQQAALSPQKSPFPWGDLDPIQYMVPWAHPRPQPKQHLDQFSHFWRAHYCDRPRQTTLLSR